MAWCDRNRNIWGAGVLETGLLLAGQQDHFMAGCGVQKSALLRRKGTYILLLCIHITYSTFKIWANIHIP